jgi:hypothetical protein
MLRLSISAFVFAIGLAPIGSHAASSTPEAIMSADAKGLFTSAYSSVDPRKSVSIVEFEGRKAAKIELRYEWKGGPLDWNRFGQPGYGQRSQFYEKENKRMRPGKDYWYTVSVFIPADMGEVKAPLQLFDLKHVIDDNGSVPTIQFKLYPATPQVAAGLEFESVLAGKWTCGTYRNAEGGKTPVCNRLEQHAYIGTQAEMSGRWLELVAHLRWAAEDGIVNIWFDGKPIYGIEGDTLKAAKLVQFKFGPYRIEMNGDPGPVTLYYSHIARAASCEALGIAGCDDLYTSIPDGLHNMTRMSINRFNELDEMKAEGR